MMRRTQKNEKAAPPEGEMAEIAKHKQGQLDSWYKKRAKLEAKQRRIRSLPETLLPPEPVWNELTMQVEQLKRAIKKKSGWFEKLSDPMVRFVR